MSKVVATVRAPTPPSRQSYNDGGGAIASLRVCLQHHVGLDQLEGVLPQHEDPPNLAAGRCAGGGRLGRVLRPHLWWSQRMKAQKCYRVR